MTSRPSCANRPTRRIGSRPAGRERRATRRRRAAPGGALAWPGGDGRGPGQPGLPGGHPDAAGRSPACAVRVGPPRRAAGLALARLAGRVAGLRERLPGGALPDPRPGHRPGGRGAGDARSAGDRRRDRPVAQPGAVGRLRRPDRSSARPRRRFRSWSPPGAGARRGVHRAGGMLGPWPASRARTSRASTNQTVAGGRALRGFRTHRSACPARVRRRSVADLDPFRADAERPTEDAGFTDMILVEVGRGCARGCRFCAAGCFYRPVRHRGLGALLPVIERAARRGAAHRPARGIGLRPPRPGRSWRASSDWRGAPLLGVVAAGRRARPRGARADGPGGPEDGDHRPGDGDRASPAGDRQADHRRPDPGGRAHGRRGGHPEPEALLHDWAPGRAPRGRGGDRRAGRAGAGGDAGRGSGAGAGWAPSG